MPPRNALIDETQTEQWPTGPDEKVRLSPTVARLLDWFRRASHTKADQLRLGALKVGLIEGIVDERFGDVYDALGKLTGRDAPHGKSLPRRD